MPIAKSVKSQVRSTESSHIVNTTIRLSHNAVDGLFAGTGGSGGGHPIGGDECPALDQLGEQDCQGAVSRLSWLPPDSPQVSTCWSPGQPDGDCPNFGLCCFDGCADTCGEGESSPVFLS